MFFSSFVKAKDFFNLYIICRRLGNIEKIEIRLKKKFWECKKTAGEGGLFYILG